MNNEKIKNTFLDYFYNYEYFIHQTFLCMIYGFWDTESVRIRALSVLGYFPLLGCTINKLINFVVSIKIINIKLINISDNIYIYIYIYILYINII